MQNAQQDDPLDGYFGESVAAGYDDPSDPANDPVTIGRTVGLLAELAEGGPVLELAVGTGRLAAPLAQRGLHVRGIEMSGAMAARVPDKPGGERVQVTVGDMTTTRVAGEFSLVFLAFNTLNNVTTQDGQVAVFANAAAHLRPGGRFLVEVGVPPLRRMPPGQDTVPFTIEADGAGGGYAGFDRLDVVTQQFTSNHVRVEEGMGRFREIPFRYVWPAELDLMARMAGMVPEHRWSDWRRKAFTAKSESHVSVWRRPA